MRGSIRKRGKTWYARYYSGRDENGKPKYVEKGGFPTKRAAEEYLARTLTEINRQTYVQPSHELIRDFAEAFLRQKKLTIREGTLRKYKWLVKKYIIPGMGHMELCKLRPQHLQQFYAKLIDQHKLSKRSVKHVHVLLKQMLKHACKLGKLAVNPADAVQPPRPDEIEMSTWNEEEILKFLETARNSRYYIFFLVALGTGMRCGEILGLKWRDVDFQTDMIHVQRSYTHAEKGYKFEAPKTKKGRRSIAVPKVILAELEQHRALQQSERALAGPAWQDDDLVVATSLGKPVQAHNVRMAFKRLIQQSGVKAIRIHDLRHTHATMLGKNGVHPRVIQERLGHEDIAVTLQTYSHVLPIMQEEAVRKIDEILSRSIPQCGYGQHMGKRA